MAASIVYTYTDAADGTITPNTGDLNNAGDWSTSSGTAAPGTIVVPGTTTTFTDTSVIEFNNTDGTTAGAGMVIDTGINRNLQEIEFENFGTAGDLGSYIVGSSTDTLYFTTGGTNILAGYVGTGNVVSPTETIASNIMATHSSTTNVDGVPTGSDLVIQMLAPGTPGKGTNGYDGTLDLTGTISTVAASGNTDIVFEGSGGASNSVEAQSDIINVQGAITNGTNATVSVLRQLYAVVDFSGVNTYSGGFVQGVASGSTDDLSDLTEIGVNSVGSAGNIVSGAFGTGAITFFNGDIASDGTTARTILNTVNFGMSVSNYTGSQDGLTYGGGRTIGFGSATAGTGTITLAGNVALYTYGSILDPTANTNGSLAMYLDILSNVNITGVLSGSEDASATVPLNTGGYDKFGGGALSLSNSTGNIYHGTTTVAQGALLVSNASGSATGDGAVNVLSGATLGGSGFIVPSKVTSGSASTVAVSFAAGSILNPSVTPVLNTVGNAVMTSQTAISTLTFSLNSGTTVNFATGTKFVFDLGAVGASDEVFVTGGQASFNGQLFSDFTFNAENGFGAGTYTLIDSSNAGALGALGAVTTGSLDGGLYTGTITLTSSGDLDLTVVAATVAPEPSVWTMALGGFGVLLAFQAYRRKQTQV